MEFYEAVVKILRCYYEFYGSTEITDKIIDRYHELVKLSERYKLGIPLIIEADGLMSDSWDDVYGKFSAKDMKIFRAKILADAKGVDAVSYLEERYREHAAKSKEDASKEEFCDNEYYGPLYNFDKDDKGKTIPPEVVIAMFHAKHSWEMPAWAPQLLEDQPKNHCLVAVFKYWSQKYGAVPIATSSRHWDFTVEFPPKTAEEAYALAKEQFALSYQMAGPNEDKTDSVQELADKLLNSPTWKVWFD
ncbi:MAG: DUF4253 domain-containing protein [Clostridiales bacterium]|nr:DUF4253 domain-containing protein [Clostridiales bacterium]